MLKMGVFKPNRLPAQKFQRLRTILSLALLIIYLKRCLKKGKEERKGRKIKDKRKVSV
jgi:hypothetical protein